MSKKLAQDLNLKPVCSVADTIKQLGMSRAQFYNLMKQGIFPPPAYCIRTRRPLYDITMQVRCLEIRESNIGYNGQYALFYSPRKPKIETENAPAKKRKQPKADNTLQEFADTLGSMGMTVGTDQITAAITELYDGEIGTRDHGLIIRDLYRYFKNRA